MYKVTGNEKMIKNRFRNTLMICSIVGGSVGFVIYLAVNLNWFSSIPDWVFFILGGILLGLIFGLLLPYYLNFRQNFYLDEISVMVPRCGNMIFKVNKEYRVVAWNLFIETITRISTQPLNEEQGILEESLDSIYQLFLITRDLLKEMEPSKDKAEMTVELLAVKMLNNELRPFLSKWHPRFECIKITEIKIQEEDWEYSKIYRQELENLRKDIISYAEAFGKLSGVSDLEKYFENQTD